MDREIYQAHSDHDENHWWFRGRREIVKEVLKNKLTSKNQKVILDVGSGAGGMIPMLQKFGTITALEPDIEMVALLKKRFLNEVEVIHGTLDSLPEQKNFDLISLFDVLEHISDDQQALNVCCDKLSENGILVLTVPLFPFLWSEHDVANHHYRRYYKTEVLKKLQKAGFSIQYVSYINFWLFPIVCLARVIGRFHTSKRNDFQKGNFFNTVLFWIFSSEHYLLRWFKHLPWGVSLLCIASKNK